MDGERDDGARERARLLERSEDLERDGRQRSLIGNQRRVVNGGVYAALIEMLLERGALVGLWLPRTPLFSASVRVCVPVVEIGGSTDVVQRWRGPSAELASVAHVPDGEMDAGKWADLAADLLGVPDVDVREGQPLGVVATATAGFRDQFYGLRPFVRERADGDDAAPVRLVTSGSIDLVNDLSARRRITFAGTSWTDPVVDVERMRHDDPALARWAERVLVPKVVLATQTRVVEVLVDETGSIWPSVPVVAVVAEPEELWRVAAALASPPVCALALRLAFWKLICAMRDRCSCFRP